MKKTLFANSIAHLLTDALCAAALFGGGRSGETLAYAALLYNTLAFSTQCAVGLLTDRMERQERPAALSLSLCALAVLLPLPYLARVTAVGLANSFFHVAAGTVTLKGSKGRAALLGVFVAPGAVGLALGTLFPGLGALYAAAGLLCAVLMWFCAEERLTPSGNAQGAPILAVVALLLAVAVRALGGTAASFPWKTGAAPALLLALCVAAGKCGGGYVCDRLGAAKTALLSVPAAALLIALCGQWMLPSLLGQALINLTMPVTLWLLYRAMPDAPGVSFGLAASALWPGSLAGGYISLSGAWRALLILLCLSIGLWAVLYSQKKLLEASK